MKQSVHIHIPPEILPKECRDNLVRRLERKHADLIEVYTIFRRQTRHWGTRQWYRAKVRLPNGLTQRWWYTSYAELKPRWKWDGEKGKVARLEFERSIEAAEEYLRENTPEDFIRFPEEEERRFQEELKDLARIEQSYREARIQDEIDFGIGPGFDLS
jgi:hypothetical protein